MDKKINSLKGKNILVFGMGKTGISVINKIGYLCGSITAVDSNPDLDIKGKIDKSRFKNVKLILGKDVNSDKNLLKGIDLVIVSPGVPEDIPLINYIKKENIPIWSEIELSWKVMDEKEKNNTIAVTGTNGKTTVVNLLGQIMKNSGFNVEVCGNVGNPLINTINSIDCATNGKYNDGYNLIKGSTKIRIVEVSSFQLEWIYHFKPHIGIILNITPDHIDRHRTLKQYIDLKFRLFLNQNKNDYAIINIDDKNILKKLNGISHLSSTLIKYGLNYRKENDLWHKDGYIFYNFGNLKGKVDIKEASLVGVHNIYNILAAVSVAKLYNINDKRIEYSIRNFKPLAHRFEYLGVIRNIRCYNDSKSTNPDATIKALLNFKKEVTLILGGLDKNMDFRPLVRILDKKVNNLILIGKAAFRIYELINKKDCDFNIYMCSSLEEAVETAFKVTLPKEVILLSPSCASMDMFKDYVERGEKFKNLVMGKMVNDRRK